MNCVCDANQVKKGTLLWGVAKTVRVLTIPPIMVGALLTILYFGADVFETAGDYWLLLIFLAVVPVLAYPFQKMVPNLHAGGRKTQRNLAFLFSFIGYTGAVGACVLRGAMPKALYISVVYLLSVVILTLINCLTPWHASGHGCSLMGPLLLICLFVGWYALPVVALFYAASLWASLYMKRHTLKEFLLGSMSSALSALICFFIIHPVF